jgi:GTP cyclohydrolase I
MPAFRNIGNGKFLGADRNLRGVTQRRKEVSVKNGNGKQDLSAVATLEGRLEVVPEGILPVVRRETALHTDRLAEIVKLLLVELGVDVANQHFRETPERVARFYREFTRGFCVRPETILKTFRSEARELVVVSAIDFFSLCPHHLLVYGGRIHFGYIPHGQIVGVSKIPRLVHALAARPIVQEELVSSIADAFMSVVKPSGCIVKAIGKHDCVAVRGVRCPAVSMTTVTKRGIFEQEPLHAEEFDRAITEGQHCTR